MKRQSLREFVERGLSLDYNTMDAVVVEGYQFVAQVKWDSSNCAFLCISPLVRRSLNIMPKECATKIVNEILFCYHNTAICALIWP